MNNENEFLIYEEIPVVEIIAQKIDNDGRVIDIIKENTMLEMEKKTGVHNSLIARSIDIKAKRGNIGNDGNRFIFSRGNEKIVKVTRKNMQKIREKLMTNKKLNIQQKIDNIERIGIEICNYRIDEDGNLKLSIKCMKCGEPLEPLAYYSILSSEYNLCKKCRQIINRKKQSHKKKYSTRLIDSRPEILDRYTYDEKENNNIKLEDLSESSNKDIIIRCKECKEKRKLTVSDITARNDNGDFKKILNCKKCYQESIKIKRVFPKLIDMVDIELESARAKLSKELTREKVLNMSAKSKDKLPIVCFKCGEPHDVVVFQIVKQNRSGVKLCNICKTLMQTSFHHIYLLDYLLKTGDDIECEKVMKVGDKYLRADILNNTKMKAYEVNGPQHKDKNNSLNVRAAKKLGITVDELFKRVTENDKMKKNELEKRGYEVIIINIEEVSIIDMLREISGQFITELPEIDFNKYKILNKVPEVQDLIYKNLSAEEIAKKVKLSKNTIYNYIRDGLVRVPEGRRIGKRMNKI